MSRQYFPNSNSSPMETSDSDLVVILAALVCALICLLGLVSIACFRLSSSSPAANKGLKKKILRSLPKQTFTSEAKFSDCAICLAEFTAGEEIRVLPHCHHSFHVACIDTWLGSHSSCPSCRNILVCDHINFKQGSCPSP